MVSGKNHDRAILFTSPIVGIIGVSYSLELGIIAASAHLLGGLYLSPDLDLKSKPFKRWGVLRVLWLPYQKLIPCHRHWLSHGVIVGSDEGLNQGYTHGFLMTFESIAARNAYLPHPEHERVKAELLLYIDSVIAFDFESDF